MRKRLNEEYPKVNPKLYTNITFNDGVVSDSSPSKDNINPSLLDDINSAARRAGVTVGITTAVSGHKHGTRHESGNAVDISMFNGKGFSNQQDAHTKGIAQGIYDFVIKLTSMGYDYNLESANDKSVLSFEFGGHDNHVHVSRTTSEDMDNNDNNKDDNKVTKPNSEESEVAVTDKYNVYGNLVNSLPGLDDGADAMRDLLKLNTNLKESVNSDLNKLNVEINKIKKMMKSWNY